MLDRIGTWVIPPWIWWAGGGAALAALLLGAYAWGRVDGQAIEERKHLAFVARQSAQATAVAQADVKTIVQTEVIYRDRIQTVKEKGNVIIKEVPVYVQAPDNERCIVNAGFVRVHRASTTGNPAGSPAESDREPAGVDLSTVAAVDAENNKNHRACREQVAGWKAFYRELQESRARQ